MAIDGDTFEEFIYIVIGVAAAVLNLVEIILIKRGQRRIKPHEKLLLSLALSDILVAVTVVIYKVFDIAIEANYWLDEGTFSIILVSSLKMSGLNLLAITFDRFLAVKWPLKHRLWESKLRINVVIAVIWVIGTSLTALFAGLIFTNNLHANMLFYISSIISISLGLVMKMMYLYILHKACTSRDMTRNSSLNHREVVNSFFSMEFRKERHMFFTCCFIYLSFIACFYPFSIEFMIELDASKVSSASRLLLIVNSTLNPFVNFFKGYLEKRRRECTRDVIPMT